MATNRSGLNSTYLLRVKGQRKKRKAESKNAESGDLFTDS